MVVWCVLCFTFVMLCEIVVHVLEPTVQRCSSVHRFVGLLQVPLVDLRRYLISSSYVIIRVVCPGQFSSSLSDDAQKGHKHIYAHFGVTSVIGMRFSQSCGMPPVMA